MFIVLPSRSENSKFYDDYKKLLFSNYIDAVYFVVRAFSKASIVYFQNNEWIEDEFQQLRSIL